MCMIHPQNFIINFKKDGYNELSDAKINKFDPKHYAESLFLKAYNYNPSF